MTSQENVFQNNLPDQKAKGWNIGIPTVQARNLLPNPHLFKVDNKELLAKVICFDDTTKKKKKKTNEKQKTGQNRWFPLCPPSHLQISEL